MSSATSPSVTPIRSVAQRGPARELDALLVDPPTDPATFDALAAAHPTLWAAATMLAALARIVGDDRGGTATEQIVDVAAGNVDGAAVAVVRGLRVTVGTQAAGVALASAARHDSDVLALTHGVEVVDDVTALVSVYRATALARLGMLTSAAEVVDRVLRVRRLHPAVRTFALRQRNGAWLSERMV